jgi:hypothetical protein
MSILDDAIREHLELKRAHGADAAELKRLEDEAFGPPSRPDELEPPAEAPTEFLGAAEAGGSESDGAETSGRRLPITDLQEAPEAPKEGEQAEPEAPTHSTDERQAIAEQPTEHFDVGAEADVGSEAEGPSDEELLDAEISEPRLAPVDPLADVDSPATESDASVEPEIAEAAAEEEEEDDFFSEQRLSDELSQALDAPLADDDDDVDDDGDYEEADYEEADEDDEEFEEDEEEPEARAGQEPEDVLEDTPDFLEDTPEDDDLWFEQRPPKDFDFDD